MCDQGCCQEKKYFGYYLVVADSYLKSALFSEIEILSKLKSPNIVGFYDVLESNHNYYLVQELCNGDLESYLKSKPDNIIS